MQARRLKNFPSFALLTTSSIAFVFCCQKTHKLTLMIARTRAINKMVPQHPPHNVQKCQVAKMLVEGDMIQDLIDHK